MPELTKEFFEEVVTRLATKEDLSGLVTLEALDQRLSELPTKEDFKALKSTVEKIEAAVNEIKKDNDAFTKDIVRHDRAIDRIEKRLYLKPSHKFEL